MKGILTVSLFKFYIWLSPRLSSQKVQNNQQMQSNTAVPLVYIPKPKVIPSDFDNGYGRSVYTHQN